jgi:hypothetical protein
MQGSMTVPRGRKVEDREMDNAQQRRHKGCAVLWLQRIAGVKGAGTDSLLDRCGILGQCSARFRLSRGVTLLYSVPRHAQEMARQRRVAWVCRCSVAVRPLGCVECG